MRIWKLKACPFKLQLLSSQDEAVVYLSSKPGIENKSFSSQKIKLENIALRDADYKIEIWKLAAPGGIIKEQSSKAVKGKVTIELPGFVDDLIVHILKS